MRVLLLGGTGAMGIYLSELLVERGVNVYVTSRSDRTKVGINYIKGDAHNLLFLKETLEVGFDVVVDFMIYNTEEFRQRVELLLDSTGQYIYFSSARVYAESITPLTEESPRLLDICKDKDYLATDEYALTKARQENLLFKSSTSNWTIIRPYITYSSSRLQLGSMEKEKWLFRALREKSIIVPKDVMSHTTTMTYGYDVAQAIVRLVANKKAYGKTVHITGENHMKWEAVLNIYLDVISEKTGIRPQIFVLDNSDILMKKMNNEYQVKYDRLYNRVFDNSRSKMLCGQIDYTPMDVGLSKCLSEFLEGDYEYKTINWRFEAWADRISRQYEPINKVPGWKNKCKYILSVLNIL